MFWVGLSLFPKVDDLLELLVGAFHGDRVLLQPFDLTQQTLSHRWRYVTGAGDEGGIFLVAKVSG